MLLTAHLLTGAFIGKESGSIPIAIFLGLLSHYLLDSIPHNDGPDDGKKIVDGKYSKSQYILVFCDLSLSVLIFCFLFIHGSLNLNVVFGAVGAIIPDLMEQVYFLNNLLMRSIFFKKVLFFHNFIQKNNRVNIYLGLGIQYIISLLFFFLII